MHRCKVEQSSESDIICKLEELTMTRKESLVLWNEAVIKVRENKFREALAIFCSIPEMTSRIQFDIAAINHRLGNNTLAIQSLTEALRRDKYLVVAYILRGCICVKLQRFHEAVKEFEDAYEHMRGCDIVDYKHMGMAHKVYTCQVLQNLAMAQASLNHWSEAVARLQEASDTERTPSLVATVYQALSAAQRCQMFELIELPPCALFCPDRQLIAQLEKKDYLGKPKVISVAPKHVSTKRPGKDYTLAPECPMKRVSCGELPPSRSPPNYAAPKLPQKNPQPAIAARRIPILNVLPTREYNNNNLNEVKTKEPEVSQLRKLFEQSCNNGNR